MKISPRLQAARDRLGPYDHSRDYMGPNNHWLNSFISRSAYGIDFNICSYQHDLDYEVGGNLIDRWIADLKFLKCMRRRINWYTKPYSLRRFLARRRVNKRFLAVFLFGGPCFNYTDEPKDT